MFIAGLAICFVVAAASLINPYISGLLVGAVQDGTWREKLIPFVSVFVLVTFIRTASRYGMLNIFEHASQNTVLDLRNDIYNWIQGQNYSFFDTNRVGDIMARMTADLDAVRHFSSYVIYAVFENIIIFIAAIIMMFTISWQLTLIMLAVAPITAILARKQATRVKPAFFTIRERFSKLNSVCEENIGGNRVVKAFAQEAYEKEKFTEANQSYYDGQIAASKIWAKYMPWLDFCANILNVALLLGGGILVITGRLELWRLVTINGCLWALNNPMRQFGFLVNDAQNFFASLDKICEMLRKRVYIQNPENPVRSERLNGAVEFRNVTFSYDKNEPHAAVLKNISFYAAPGSSIGIVGATGSGKTTLVNLIGRFYDVTGGEVLVDGINVKDYDLQNLRRDIATAAQDVFLFSDTVEGNVAYAVPEAPMERLTRPALAADADGFIRELEDGYDTIVGERGVGLSGGQKQRLSLARALAANPSILILDDTTSAVDMETEHGIQQALKQYKGQTKFIIAHRISSVKPADMILVMDKGEITERGTHEELLARRGIYHQLFEAQYGTYEIGADTKKGGVLVGA
jgi:ATP-binding cassette subfamily B protein